ncbi:methylated-DNA--[protein]-cysteine S-methyltransferase [Heliobacterium undosum]|uniref:Methylated-DNA--protein-cysteine methyltransferase n=1 Tax=Heliomicrobium undosum TaxID=121734 RepID=A0A845L4R8_9FIRM|nr:methylated-DNA--[protein]-cysteine S-methyltransferase [Heliomicrobium undosum]MZP30696.1 methylated-DNA--[protein]-cysteine S-methyltransferase [Heliomicrobium undosum]
MALHRTYYRTAIGLIEIRGTERGIEGVSFVEADEGPQETDLEEKDLEEKRPKGDGAGGEGQRDGEKALPACLQACVQQLDEYFQGARQSFSLALALQGTAFQRRVWEALAAIPFGETRSYREIAEAIGNPKAVRAVGGANHNNPVGIIVPCHRVIGSDGSLTGYGGGLWRKEWLLNHEKAGR